MTATVQQFEIYWWKDFDAKLRIIREKRWIMVRKFRTEHKYYRASILSVSLINRFLGFLSIQYTLNSEC